MTSVKIRGVGKVYSGDGKEVAIPTGGEYRCRMEGCGGRRIAVRWPNGRITHPCTRGLQPYRNDWKIPTYA